MTESIDFLDPNRLNLTSVQIRVIETLESLNPEKYSLADWYLGAVHVFNNTHNPDRLSQAANSLRELLEKLFWTFAEVVPRQPPPNLNNMRKNLDQRLVSDKERYKNAWEGKEIDASLDRTICSVDKYLQLSKRPSRSEQIANAFTKMDPMYEILPLGIQQQKRERIHKLWKGLQSVTHHNYSITNDDFGQLFDGVDHLIIEIFAPITAEDQDAIRAILEKPKPKQEAFEELFELIKRRGANYKYFFEKVDNSIWLAPLKQKGFFNNPPNLKNIEDDQIVMQFWPPISYLKKVSDKDPEQVVEIICDLIKTDNPRILSEIFSMAGDLEDANLSLRLEPLINQYLKSPYRWGNESDLIITILKKWSNSPGRGRKAAHKLIQYVTSFQKDPDDAIKRDRYAKRARYKENSDIWDTLLRPAPRFDQWHYERILEKGVRAVADIDPSKVAFDLINAVKFMIDKKIHDDEFFGGNNRYFSQIWCPRFVYNLISAVKFMINPKTHDDEHGERSDQDSSQIWCLRLDKSDAHHTDTDEILVRTLTYACEQVYDKDPESIASLDKKLRRHHWKIFKRLRQHLYSLHPNDQTLPWIREEILSHQDYSRCEHHYEFQLMIRKASEHFKAHLLSAEEQKAIFGAIRKGPWKEDSRARMGGQYTEEGFTQYQRYFHRAQLRPFAALLSGDIQQYFDELELDLQSETITDDIYMPHGPITGGTISWQSPRSTDDLNNLTDDEILNYLNDWDEVRRDKDNGFIEVNISALAGEFQTLFKEKILPNGERLNFWIKNRDRIARPIYVAAMLKPVIDLVKEKNFDNLNQWIEFCAWVLLHPDAERVEGKPIPQETSRDYLDWGSSRRAVVDFIDVCVNKDKNKDTDAPITARKGLADLLQQACDAFDWQLDHNHPVDPVALNYRDPITEGINNTRSRALESLIHFGFWIRRHLPKDDLLEVTDILTKRMTKDAEFPLTEPEHAILGLHFGNLHILNPEWATLQREIIFPRTNESVWRDAFSSYIRYNHPSMKVFEILRGEFEYAIENMNIFAVEKDGNKKIITILGQRLFLYYLWEVYPLKGEASLLERFYEKTKNKREHWGGLFDHVGRLLKNNNMQENKPLINRVIAFFNWRYEAEEPSELIEFSFWLEAECLDLEWRLNSYLKILALPQGNSDGFRIFIAVGILKKLLSDHPALVIKCVAKISDQINLDNQPSIPSNDMIDILKVGLASEDYQIFKDAEYARENFFKVGFITAENLK